MKVDFGPMARFETQRHREGRPVLRLGNPYAMLDEEIDDAKGSVLDLVLPIVVLVVCCVIGMIYSGGFFSGGADFVTCLLQLRRVRGPACWALPSRLVFTLHLLLRAPVHVLQGDDGLHPRGLQGHGSRHPDPHLRLDPEGHDRLPGRQVFRP